LSAEVKQIREYHLHQPRDRKVLFGMGVTPEQDVLAFVAKEDGKWRLSRVRGWLDRQPGEETVEVAGLTRKDFARPEGPWYASLLVTSNGEFVVCISSGNGRRADGERGREFDEIVSVVDLKRFNVLKTAHSPASRDEIRQYSLDSAGHLVLRASKPLPGPEGMSPSFGNDVRIVLLNLPDLTTKEQCHYAEWMRNGAVVRREGERDCDPLPSHAPGGPKPLSEFLDQLRDSYEARPKEAPKPYCSATISPDGRFKDENCTDFHRNWWGNPVVTNAWEDIFSMRTRKQIGTVNITVRDSASSRFAELNGRNYLILMEGGTKLKVYELTE
jgi:hypothetical protein